MSLAFGEFEALAAKAARGIGLNWGLAFEAGLAAQWLERHGCPGAASLVAYLEWIDSRGEPKPNTDIFSTVPDVSMPRCPIRLGCLIADTDRFVQAKPICVVQPLLLVPFIALTTNNKTIKFAMDEIILTFNANGVDCGDTCAAVLVADTATVGWAQEASGFTPADARSRVKVEKSVLHKLERFAGRTYAPATEASRLAGAGAGTTDND